ncbi:MAG: LTA synthase family protein [Lachnospiraceae bacterium]
MKRRVKEIAKTVLMILVPVFVFYLFEWFTHNPFQDMRMNIQIYNIILFELLMVLFFALTGSLRIALLTEILLFVIYGLANYFVLSFRSQPIQPWDFYSIGTAMSVAGDFTYKLDRDAILALIGFLLLALIVILCGKKKLKKNYVARGISVVCSLLLLGVYVNLLHNEEFVEQDIRMYDKLFTPTTMSYKDGTAVAFLLELQYMDVDVPDGYDAEEEEQILAAKNVDMVQKRPNIIVIMDEAFSDPKILGDFMTSQDYMPFVHSLLDGAENTISGKLHVSVKGGNTANTEFEFLTGNTMAFLPQGSVPYQQYLYNETPSLASHLSGLGYLTRAAHPYYASGWDRETVYPLLGFEQSDFIDSFPAYGKIRKYVSDATAFSYIKDVYESKGDDPLFLFEVTMQNHSGYTESYANFTPDVVMEDGGTDALNMYLSLLRQSDLAFEDLITYFAGQEEDTVIVFFGDHQPSDSVVEPVLKQNGKSGSTLTEEEQKDRYVVPFVIWANFDIEEADGVEISANYLSELVLSAAGLPLSPYQQYLEEIREQIPVISAEETRLADTAYEDALTEYQKMQYYMLFE